MRYLKEKRQVLFMELKRKIGIIILSVLTIIILSIPYSTSYLIVLTQQTPILSQNWWQALNWIKDNTPDCSVIATYWDPGHFITGIAERPVVFDGASQNSIRTIEIEGNLSQEEIKKIAVIDNYQTEIIEKDGKIVTRITTARIQDIGTTLFTDNETKAVEILKKYMMPNCNDSMYYIASSDLIGKSQWWTYFSTWTPETHSGDKYVYMPVGLAQTKPVITEDAVGYIYPFASDQAFIIYEKNKTLTLMLQQGSNWLKVKKLFYFKDNNGYLEEYPDAEIKGMVWLSPDKTWIIYIPDELVNSMFTRMFLFNGQGLEKFEFAGNWGGEVKLFKVKFD